MQTYNHHSGTHTQPTTTEGIRPCSFSGDSGDTRDFLLWLNHIQVYLKKLPSVEERILSLYQATAGEAREVMEAFLFEPKTKTTLDSALMTLREIYGSEPMVGGGRTWLATHLGARSGKGVGFRPNSCWKGSKSS